MKGVILAGGFGTRLSPLTKGVSKHLLPIYNKPMIYYSIALLLEANIKDILIVTTRNSLDSYKRLLGNGNFIGININYVVQEFPKGTADAVSLAKNFVNNDKFLLIYGDNLLYCPTIEKKVLKCLNYDGVTIFCTYVKNPELFGIVEFDREMNVISIEEKPIIPKSNYCSIGLYCYNNSIFDLINKIELSKRGELEITDINKIYLKKNMLQALLLDKNSQWFDLGSVDSLKKASDFIFHEERKNNYIGYIEEIAYKKEYLSKESLREIIAKNKTSYYNYLKKYL